MNLNRVVEAAKHWADEHRELVVISVALPLSTIATAWQRIRSLGAKAMGLQREATIETKDATMSGLLMALGTRAHSHVCGLAYDTVTAYEIVTPQPQRAMALQNSAIPCRFPNRLDR